MQFNYEEYTEQLRTQLVRLVNIKQSFTDTEVVALSVKLDYVLLLRQKAIMNESLDSPVSNCKLRKLA